TIYIIMIFFFFSSRRRHTRSKRDWSSNVCSSDLIAESEVDLRFNSIDQGSITFHRYNNHLQEPIIWFHDLVFDHPTRDIAEYLRYQFLINQNRGSSDITSFLEDYQQVRPDRKSVV